MKKESPNFWRRYEEKSGKKLKQGLIYKNERNNDFYTKTSAYWTYSEKFSVYAENGT